MVISSIQTEATAPEQHQIIEYTAALNIREAGNILGDRRTVGYMVRSTHGCSEDIIIHPHAGPAQAFLVPKAKSLYGAPLLSNMPQHYLTSQT